MMNINKIAIGILVMACVALFSYCKVLTAKIEAKNEKINNLNVEVAKKASMIASLNRSNKENNEIIERNQQEINQLRLKADEVQEQLSEQIQKSQCANVVVPSNVVDILRAKATNINQQANTSKPDTARSDKAVKK